jgi:hypothetical protein
MAATYGGVGVLHAPAATSALLARDYQMYISGVRMLTWLGNIVSLGAGYGNTVPGTSGDPEPAPDGEAWLMISGPVIIRRQAVDVPGGDEGANKFGSGVVDIILNDRYVLAERTSVVGVECDVFSILVDLEAISGGGGGTDDDLQLE